MSFLHLPGKEGKSDFFLYEFESKLNYRNNEQNNKSKETATSDLFTKYVDFCKMTENYDNYVKIIDYEYARNKELQFL